MLKNIDAIIFDMDGVIVDSEPLHFELEQAACRDHGIQVPLSEWDGRWHGTKVSYFFKYIINTYGNGVFSVSDLLVYKNKMYLEIAPKKLKPIPGALEYIKKVKEREKKLALTTSSEKELQEMVFGKFNLHPYFNVIVTGDEIEKGKPDPEPYLKTVEKLGIPASQCLVIEDAVNGILSAKAAGCVTVGITTSFPAKSLHEAGADYVINTFYELSDIWNNR